MRHHTPHIILLLFAILTSWWCSAQNDHSGKVTINAPTNIDRLVEKHREISKLHPEFEGYRVQIFFDSGNNSKSKAFEAYKNFLSRYPGYEAYVVYQEPNYKVRAGDFRTRLEAEGFLRQVVADFPSAFVIKDMIKFPPLDGGINISQP
jgi:hypothetical protein